MRVPLIESVEPIEFRGIKACKKPVKLSRFTVLIGRNNSGKTSILEAISMLPVIYITGVSRFPPITWDVRKFMKCLHRDINSLIYGYTGRAIINYVVRGEKIVWQYDENKGITIENEYSISEEELKLRRRDRILFEMLRDFREHLAELLDAKGRAQLTSILLLPNDARFLAELANALKEESEWAKVEKSGANTSIVDLIDRVVYDRFTEATVRFDKIVLRKELPDGRVFYVNISDIGDGVERVLIYGLWLETYKPKVVLWDDLEASAHPGLIEAVLEWLASREWQVVLTTHSYDVLERLVAIEPEDASVVVLKKGPDDILEPKTLSLEELRSMLESHVDVRKVVDII